MDVKELENKTVAELKEMAKELGVPGISAMKKADLVAAIAGASDASASAEASADKPAPAPESEVEASAPAEATADEAPDPEPEPAVEAAPEEEGPAESGIEEPAMEAAPEAESEPEPAVEAAPEPEVEAAPEPEPEPEPKKAAPAPEPEPKVKEIVLTKVQTRLRAKHDLPALKLEKRALQSQIQAAIAAKDSAKMKELRGRKKEIRRLLNRV
jgi:hypothetical protein